MVGCVTTRAEIAPSRSMLAPSKGYLMMTTGSASERREYTNPRDAGRKGRPVDTSAASDASRDAFGQELDAEVPDLAHPLADRPAGAHPVDIHVGARLRLRRMFVGMTRAELAVAIGANSQTIFEFERGERRIGAGRLFDIARIFDVQISYFFRDNVTTDA